MKKFLTFILIFVMLTLSVLCVPADAMYSQAKDSLGLHSDIYLLISLNSGTVIFEKDADRQTPPASLTKIITASVVIENCNDFDKKITVPEYCLDALADTGSSLGGFMAGEEVSINDLLHALLIASANDAAMVLADYIGGGDISKFIDMMNDLAAELGCTNTSFVNPHGLDDEYQFSTARDMAVFTRHALELPLFKEIVGKMTYTLDATNLQPERKIKNTNNLMNPGYKDYYCEYASGVKTGSTSGAGKCVISTATKNGNSYLGVVMHAPLINIDKDPIAENCAFVDCKAMFDWAIRNLEYAKIADAASVVLEVPVKYSSKQDYVTLCPSADTYQFVPTGTKQGSFSIQPIDETVPEFLEAPVKKGDLICRAQVLYSGEVIAEISLAASTDIAKSPVRYALSVVAKTFSHTFVKIIAVIVAALFAALLALRWRNKLRRKREGGLHVVTYRDFNNGTKQ